jgi:hypothetical protein
MKKSERNYQKWLQERIIIKPHTMGTKLFWKSKTLQGSLVLFLLFFSEWFGFNASESELTQWVTGAVALVGFIYTIYGRISADTTLTVK